MQFDGAQTNIPLASRYQPRAVYTGSKSKCRKFYRRLRLEADSGRRPHFLYGAREQSLGTAPLFVYPTIDNSVLQHHHPLNSTFTDPDDIYKLEFLMNSLLPYMSISSIDKNIHELGYTGQFDENGQMIGL